MSCCCNSPPSAALGAGIVVLVVCVPVAFFDLVQLVFHYAELDSPGLNILWCIALLQGVIAATLIIFTTPLVIVPLAWLSYELHATARLLAGRQPLIRSFQADPSFFPPGVGAGQGSEAAFAPLGMPMPAAASKETVAQSLAHAMPYGRTRRGSRSGSQSRSQGRYAAPGSQAGVQSGSEDDSLLSSDPEEWQEKRRTRKQSRRAGRE
ncbi:hypothetical protein JCM8097_003892 [Rhodosporidiobolus ruineniae]